MIILLFMMSFNSFYNFILIFDDMNLLIKYYFLDPSDNFKLIILFTYRFEYNNCSFIFYKSQ